MSGLYLGPTAWQCQCDGQGSVEFQITVLSLTAVFAIRAFKLSQLCLFQGKQNEGTGVKQYNQYISSQESCGAIKNGSIYGQDEGKLGHIVGILNSLASLWYGFPLILQKNSIGLNKKSVLSYKTMFSTVKQLHTNCFILVKQFPKTGYQSASV